MLEGKKCSKGKKQLWQPSCRKWEEKKNLWQPSCQNCRGGERILIGILAMKLPKMERKEKRKKCGNGVAKN